MKTNTFVKSFSLMLAAAFTVQLSAQRAVTEFVPFQDFLEATKAPNSTVMNRPESRVKDSKSFEQMRRYILSLYAGVQVTHSFVADSSHFDCVPAEQQPSIRLLGLSGIAEPPPQSMLSGDVPSNDGGEGPARAASQTDAAVDQFGKSTTCEATTIPMRRVTLEEMTRFSSLGEFFQKGAAGAGRPAEAGDVTPATAAPAHKYAVLLQNVNALGGSSTLNIWSPYVNQNLNESMSLMQEWYVGGSGASLQTAEVGWQVLPGKYGTEKPVLFIYFTSDGYNTNDLSTDRGCYNQECPGFVLLPGQPAILGKAFSNYSTTSGTQYEVTAKYYLYQNNWWLAIQGTWIGYFPTSIYRGGQMSKYAQSVQFGTESVGTTEWPGEGSGAWATAGYGKAAYQRDTFYIDLSGNSIRPTLQVFKPVSPCYNTFGPFESTSTSWQFFFYVGGPQGTGC